MNSVKAIIQLESLKRDRLSFINNDEQDKIYLNDIKAINLAIKALNKCPNIRDTSFNCKMCGKELKTWSSIQRGFGPVCEKRYLEDVYNNQQINIERITQKKGEKDGQ